MLVETRQNISAGLRQHISAEPVVAADGHCRKIDGAV